MKPNNFQINSEYLSLALQSTSEHNMTVPAGQLVDGGWEWSTTFNVAQQVGAMDSYQLTFNGQTMVGSTFYINPSDIAAEVAVYRSAPGVITVGVRFYGMTGNNTTGRWDAFNLSLHVDSFKPPNLA